VKQAVIAVLVCATLQAQQNPTALVKRFKEEPVFYRQFDIAKQIVAMHDPSVLPELKPFLSHADRHVRGNAAFVFAGLGDRTGFDVIVAIVKDDSADRTRWPPQGGSGDGRNVPAYQPIAQQITEDRYFAIHLLGELKDRRAIPILLPLLSDPDVDYTIAWALGEIGGDEALDGLLLALRSPNPQVRIYAIESIQKLDAKRAIPQLRGLTNDHAKAKSGQQETVSEAAQRAIAALEK